MLTLVYAFFTLAAGARSAVQLLTHGSVAPLAYSLSGVAALVYGTGAVLLAVAERRPGGRRWAVRVAVGEIVGVVVVGAASLLVPSAFPDATVWSHFGSGYGFVPAVLPVLALVWLRLSGSTPTPSPRSTPTSGPSSTRSVDAGV